MLPKTQRLSKQCFDIAFSKSIVIRTTHFSIRYHALPKEIRWAVVVPKKQIKSAVSRNAFRRRVYAAIESCVVRVGVGSGHYILILTKAFDASPKEIEHEIFPVLARRSV